MFASFKLHRILSIIVLAVAAAWVLTGKFASVGSEQADAAEAQVEAPEAAAPEVKRTVAAVEPVFFDHAREILLFGATQPDKEVVLAARSNGIVRELGVTEGKPVEEGAQVLVLEGADVVAAVATAKAKLAEADQQLEVGKQLYARGSLAELELTSRRAAKAVADAALLQAEASADRLTLKAPFAGIVDSVSVEIGEWVQQGAPIATILALDPIVVKAEVSEQDVGLVNVGGTAKVSLIGGEVMEGTIHHVARQANVKTRTFEVEVALPNPDGTIPAGATAEVRLFGTSEPAVVVPRSVITLSDDGVIGVRVVDDANLARFVPVRLLDDTDKGMVITGVPADTRIITAGQDLVRDGDEVIVAEAEANLAGVLQ